MNICIIIAIKIIYQEHNNEMIAITASTLAFVGKFEKLWKTVVFGQFKYIAAFSQTMLLILSYLVCFLFNWAFSFKKWLKHSKLLRMFSQQ